MSQITAKAARMGVRIYEVFHQLPRGVLAPDTDKDRKAYLVGP